MLVVWSSSSLFNSVIVASCFCVTILTTPLRAEEIKCTVLNTASENPKIHFDWVRSYFSSIDSKTDPEEIVDVLISLKLTLRGLGYTPPSLQELCERLSVTQNGNEKSQETLSKIYDIILEKESSLSPLLTLAPRQSTLPKVVLAKKTKKDFHQNQQLENKLHDLAAEAGIPIRQYLDLLIGEIKAGKAGHHQNAPDLLKYAEKWADYLDHPDKYLVVTTLGGVEHKGAIALCEILAGGLLLTIPNPTVQLVGGVLVAHGVNTLKAALDELADTADQKTEKSN